MMVADPLHVAVHLVVPCGHRQQAVAHIAGLRESRIVEVFAQPDDLL